ncbi:MAG: hypothetical protein KA766_01985 [Piscinibacter sp.]|uniref:hypothetical protein n=1 Tax=Piscinibacter sp. TaxID=1903157 RepID=UPI001B5AF5B0|nr:hypothetical protein [Piscinibacter sp.]MBP5988767.1 hypothetical protein [Piscinibacter sp.]MBP6025744.1 hypothetical protein [Piscinibacter sp.]
MPLRPFALVPAFLLGLLLPATPAFAAADTARATERCEHEVAENLRRLRGRDAKEVQFLAARRVLTPQSDDETAIRGEGRYRTAGGASVSFSYGCAYNAASDSTSGVVLREAGGQRAAAAERSFDPDLTNVSPQACESAAAEALKKLHPRVARINFGSDSRRLQPAELGRVAMTGDGSVERAPGMNLIPFSYRCEVEPRSGRVTAISTKE